MEIDWFDLFSTLLQIAVVAFAVIKIVPQMRRSGNSVILVFLLYAFICLLLSDIYWISLGVVHPDERLPFSISDVADIGEQLMLASALGVIFRGIKCRKRLELFLTIVASIGLIVLWVVWTEEWTKNILGGISYGYLIFMVVLAAKKANAFSRREAIVVWCVSFVCLVLSYPLRWELVEAQLIQSIFFYTPMLILTIWFFYKSIVAVRVIMKTKENRMENARRAIAVSTSTLIWIRCSAYVSDGLPFTVFDFANTLIIPFILFSVLYHERVRLEEARMEGGAAV